MTQVGQGSVRHLLHIFPSFAVGGSQSRFATLVAAFGDGFRHTVVTLDGNRDMSCRLAPGSPVDVVVPGLPRVGLRNLPRIRRAIVGHRPALLVTYNWGAIEWALANRIAPICPHIHIEDGFGFEERNRQLARRVWMRRVGLSGRHTRIVAPSRTLETIMRDVWRLPRSRTHYVPNGIDVERFAAEPRPGHSGVVVGTLATLRPEKNLARLIEAFAGLSALTASLAIAGDGPERSNLERAADASGAADRIALLGGTRQPENFLAGIDVFAISSDTEQMPLSVLEAMAAGLPIVGLAVGDVADMVADVNRPFIVPPHEEADFRAALATMIERPELRRALGAANQEKARRLFSRAQMVDGYRALFG